MPRREMRKMERLLVAVPVATSGFLVQNFAIKGRFIRTSGPALLPILPSAMR